MVVMGTWIKGQRGRQEYVGKNRIERRGSPRQDEEAAASERVQGQGNVISKVKESYGLYDLPHRRTSSIVDN